MAVFYIIVHVFSYTEGDYRVESFWESQWFLRRILLVEQFGSELVAHSKNGYRTALKLLGALNGLRHRS